MNIKFRLTDNWDKVEWVLGLLLDARFISSWSRSGDNAECYIKNTDDLQFVLRLLRGATVATVEIDLRLV